MNFTIRNFYQAENAEAGWSGNEQESNRPCCPYPPHPRLFATHHAKRLSIRVHNPASANRRSTNSLSCNGTPGSHAGLHYEDKAAEGTGRQYGHRS